MWEINVKIIYCGGERSGQLEEFHTTIPDGQLHYLIGKDPNCRLRYNGHLLYGNPPVVDLGLRTITYVVECFDE